MHDHQLPVFDASVAEQSGFDALFFSRTPTHRTTGFRRLHFGAFINRQLRRKTEKSKASKTGS
jgi:hypothetical protein